MFREFWFSLVLMRISVKKVRSLIKRRNSSAEEMEKAVARRRSEQEAGVTLDDLSWHPSSRDYYSADHLPDEVFCGASLDRRYTLFNFLLNMLGIHYSYTYIEYTWF